MSDSVSALKGMDDISFPEVGVWQMLESRSRQVLHRYAMHEVRTPVLEHLSVFQRSLGDTTDVVQKEMFAFTDRGGRDITLRPEGTAGVMRYLCNHGRNQQAERLYYLGPMFRAERPQAGRKRQFHQLGVEVIGPPNPWMDAEVIQMQQAIFQAWGVEDVAFQINTRGSFEDAGPVRQGLRDALAPVRDQLCADCQRRFEENVLRLLDCKNPECRRLTATAPAMTDFMSPESRAYFEELCRALDTFGVAYQVNPRLVRGLDYYQHTIWEVTSEKLGAQDALSGGGRYRITFGKNSVDGVGFGIGLERVIMALDLDEAASRKLNSRPDLFLVSMGDAAREANARLMTSLRAGGIACAMDLTGRKLKAQFKMADDSGATWALVRGDQELENGVVQLKNLRDGNQQELSLDQLRDTLGQGR